MDTVSNAHLIIEAKAFTRYLIGEEADELTTELYIQANHKLNPIISEKEQRRINFLASNTGFIGMVDGALALKDPESGIRKKIYILFAILESNPAYAKHFLPKKFNMPLLTIFLTGVRACWNTFMGYIILLWM